MTVARAVPRLCLAVPCSYVEFDRDGKPFSLVEPLFGLTLAPDADGSLPAPDITVYAQLDGENAAGTFWFAVEVRDARGRPIPGRYRTVPTERTFDPAADPLDPVEFVFPIAGLVFPGPGAYDLYVMCNHLPLHALGGAPPPCRVRLVPRESEGR